MVNINSGKGANSEYILVVVGNGGRYDDYQSERLRNAMISVDDG